MEHRVLDLVLPSGSLFPFCLVESSTDAVEQVSCEDERRLKTRRVGVLSGQ